LLEELGYRHVRHYFGGIADWIEHGEAVEGSKSGRPDVGGRTATTGNDERRLTSAVPEDRWPAKLLDLLANTSFAALLRLWLGVVFGCAAVYWIAGSGEPPSLMEGGVRVPLTLHGLATAVYFSFVTATSVGFGDVVPVGLVRIVAVAESATGLLIFGCVISKLVSRRQEYLIEEIHRIAFEDRLGRVRTNLHLVLSELQAISSECVQPSLAPERSLSRIESASMVFHGELRAVHDLLYRPQQVPDESVFEALLANLASGLREFCDLMERMPKVPERSALLKSGLKSISNLAGEICGECVPHEYAPELKVWMDRVHQLAGRLSLA
jgi:potassium channel LctB